MYDTFVCYIYRGIVNISKYVPTNIYLSVWCTSKEHTTYNCFKWDITSFVYAMKEKSYQNVLKTYLILNMHCGQKERDNENSTNFDE